MAITFIKGSEINTALEHLIEDAEAYLYLICPYIQLHDKLKRELRAKITQPELKIVVVFGKNEEEGLHKSLSKEDFEFLSGFPNIEIRYEPKLHAKYYSNENRAIISSMNLYKYSHDNNIEAGLLMDVKGIIAGIGSIITKGNDPESDSYYYFEKVISQAELMYKKKAVFKKSLLGLSNEYMHSEEEVNRMVDIYKVPKSVGFKNWERQESKKTGYCIRTGEEIPFNLKRPYCSKAFNTWSQFGNEDYQEKYCHFTGEESHGATTFSNPILKKNWRKANEQYKLKS